MMGHRQVEQAALFYEFSLEKHVPPDHLLRSIDRFIELDEVRRELARCRSVPLPCGEHGGIWNALLQRGPGPPQAGKPIQVTDTT